MPRTDAIDALISRMDSSIVFACLGLLVGAFALTFLVLPALFGWARQTPPGLYRAKSILTPNETEFYSRLVDALPAYSIQAQVAMSALIEPRIDPNEFAQEYSRQRASFAQKYVDFVVCRKQDLEVVAIVELDDITHDHERDAMRDEMLEGAGYHVVRWHSRKKPTKSEIARVIKRADK